MPKASELKSGMVVEVKGQPHIVKTVQANSPSARGAGMIYKVRFNHAATGQKVDDSLRSDDFLPEVDFLRRQVSFLYKDGEEFTFMDGEDYSQYTLSSEQMGDQAGFLTDGLTGIMALLVDGECIAAQLPEVVELIVVETVPGMKSASANARTKPAKLSTGIEVQVPEFIEEGETLRVNTLTQEYMSRA